MRMHETDLRAIATCCPLPLGCRMARLGEDKDYKVIDSDGFRPNVGMIICNSHKKLFWGRRVGQNAWQFPQGGIMENETPEQAMFRELEEEVGLKPEQVEIMGVTEDWLRYRLPKRYMRHNSQPLCIGQKQRWFLLKVLCEESDFCLDNSPKPEFDHWRWVKYWHPLREVVYFKRKVYSQALEELAPYLFPEGVPTRSTTNYLRQNRR